MPRSTQYIAHHELSDGRDLRMEYWCKVYPQTRWEPEDVDTSDPIFFIDGEEVSEKNLPAEVTSDLIESLENRAQPVQPEYDGPEPEYD